MKKNFTNKQKVFLFIYPIFHFITFMPLVGHWAVMDLTEYKPIYEKIAILLFPISVLAPGHTNFAIVIKCLLDSIVYGFIILLFYKIFAKR